MATGLSPAQWCQAYFLVWSAILLLIRTAPESIYFQFLGYGPRGPSSHAGPVGQPDKNKKWLGTLATAIRSASQVPHSWFLHFYLTSVIYSAFWATQLLTRGSVVTYLAQRQAEGGGPSMTLGQVALMWAMLAVQGSRRLYESLWVLKLSSTSEMWVIHWFLGVGLYLSLGISVWIEGSGGHPPPPQARSPHSSAAAN